METYPKGTTKEQWDNYYAELEHFKNQCAYKKPVAPPLYFVRYKPTPDWPEVAETANEAARIYKQAMSQWEMMCSCDAPNKPGYYRANND